MNLSSCRAAFAAACRVAFRRSPSITILAWLLAFAAPIVAAAPATTPVWVVGNGFHSSLALRARDVPFLAEVSSEPLVDELLIGWGSADVYRGKVDALHILKAIFYPGASVLHTVPIQGSVTHRFPRADVIRLELTNSQFRILLHDLDAAFARDTHGRRIFLNAGFFPGSRFYSATGHFYFPRMCNMWVAQRLRACGEPIWVPFAITATELSWQVERFGRREQRLQRPSDGF